MRTRRIFSLIEMRRDLSIDEKTAWRMVAFLRLAQLVQLHEDGNRQKPNMYLALSDAPLPLSIVDAPMDESLKLGKIALRRPTGRTARPPTERPPKPPKVPTAQKEIDPRVYRPRSPNAAMGLWIKIDGTRHNPHLLTPDWQKARCVQCRDLTIYRTLDAETLRGWRQTEDGWICHKCAKLLDARRAQV